MSLALNPQWLKENLPRYLWREDESPGKIDALEVCHVSLSSKRVVVLYQLQLNDHAAPQTRKQMYSGYVVSSDDLDAEYQAILKKARIQPPAGNSVVLVPAANLILLAFPNDRKISLLSEAKLRAWLTDHWREVVEEAHAAESWQVTETTIEVLRYIPGKRLTARCRVKLYALQAGHTPSGATREISFIAKQLHNSQKARQLYHNLLTLYMAWSRPRNGRLSHNIPHELQPLLPRLRGLRPLACDETTGVVYIENIPGAKLDQILAEIDLAAVMPAVGEILAHFHALSKRVKKRVSCKSELAEVRCAIHDIAGAYPHLRPRLRHLFKALTLSQWQDTNRSRVLLHGSFRLNHIVKHDGEFTLIDLDGLRMGHPAYDVANFLSALYFGEAQAHISPAQRQDIARHFLAGYFAKASQQIPALAVLWFLASLLINKQAGKYVTHGYADSEEKVGRMLALAENILKFGAQLLNEVNLAALAQLLP